MKKQILANKKAGILIITALSVLCIQALVFAQPTSAPPGGNISPSFDTLTTSDITLDDTAGANTPAILFNTGISDSNKIEFTSSGMGTGNINFTVADNAGAMNLYSPSPGINRLSVNTVDNSYPLIVDGSSESSYVGKFITQAAGVPTLALENTNNAGTPGIWMGRYPNDHAEINYNNAANTLDFVLQGALARKDAMRIYSPNETNVNVAINSTDLTHPLMVEGSLNDYVAKFHNTYAEEFGDLGIAIMAGGSLGQTTLVDFMNYDGSSVGNITKQYTTVSYNAFTGGHNATIPQDHSDNGYEYGTIMSAKNITTPENSHQPEYYAEPSNTQYDSNIMGVYATKNTNNTGTHQLYAVGDGHVLATTENGSIKAGDPITSSNLEGLGMKATQAGTIVGYALEDWDGSSSTRTETLADGTEVKVGLVAVYYYPGTYYTPDQTEEINSLKQEIAELKALLK